MQSSCTVLVVTKLVDLAIDWKVMGSRPAARGVPDGPNRSAGGTLHRVGGPDEIVGAAVYFASNTSSYTTGSILRVDGGMR
jgi:NAD(P)-dependent dehydrogenase (short-subunit alcohol dehydrogenase family)